MKAIHPSDPADARAVFHQLLVRVNEALRAGDHTGWRCLRAVPRIDGTLYFDMDSPSGRRRLDWIGPPGDGERFDELVLSGPSSESNRSSGVVEAVKRVLVDSLADDAFLLLRYFNRETRALEFDDGVVDFLLAGRLEPGRTTWFGYRFESAFQETGDRFRLTFRGPGGPVGFEVRPAVPPFEPEKIVLKNLLFVMELVEDCRRPEWREQVVHQVERFLGFLLSRAVHPGMKLDVRFLAGGGGGQDIAPVSTSRWGNPHQWYQFFSDFEIERSNLCSFRFVDPISWVTHGEAECCWVEPVVAPRTVTYTNVPWDQDPQEGQEGSLSLYTRMDERDAVMGGGEKLAAALDAAVRNAAAKAVFMNNTCLPKIVGDDVSSMIRRAGKKSSIPIIDLNTDLDSPDSTFQDFIRQASESLGEQPDGDGGEGLNLIGFPSNKGFREIIDTLDRLEVPRNVSVLPDIGIGLLRRYLLGRQGVVYPHRAWVKITGEVLGDLGIPWKVLAAPYGPGRTREWFESVTALMDRTTNWETFCTRWLDDFLVEWEPLVEQARDFRLVLVVDAGSLDRLVDPARQYGFEVLPGLEEMGFGLRVLVRTPEGEPAEPGEKITSALQDPGRHEFVSFSSPGQLQELLANDDFQAVYSEVFFDTRITRSGKAQFHLSMIEMGLEGALRSIRRLLGVCRWPFYRTYRRHLGAQ